MKSFLNLTVGSLALMLLTACASTGTAYEKAPMQDESVVTDNVYVATVDYIAKQRGTEVMWVNPPKKRVAEPVAIAQ